MRVVQAGAGAARDVVVVYHLGTYGDAPLIAALPAGTCILNETVPQASIGAYGPSLPTLDATLSEAMASTGAFTPRKLLLGGYSAGYLAVRTQLSRGIDPDAVVIADGIQTPRPGSLADVKVWTDYVARALRRERVFVASHTIQGQGTKLLSTEETLRLVTGFPLDSDGTIDAPVVTQEGDVAIFSYAGNDHAAQGHVVFPRLVAAATAMMADEAPPGLSTGAKVAIGLAGGALLACGLWGLLKDR